MTLAEAQAALLVAYQRLEVAQMQAHQAAQQVRECELRKVQAEAIVTLLSHPEAAHG